MGFNTHTLGKTQQQGIEQGCHLSLIHIYISNLTFSRNVVPESEAEKLPDFLKTFDCVTEHVKVMADRADLWNAVMYFAIRQYVDNYEK